MADPKAPLGSTEIEILRYIGGHHPISVGEVSEHVAQTTGQARTTILTIMERLRQKGHLTRRRIGGVYRYSPKIPTHDLLRGLVKNFVDTTLGGSVSPFVAFLAENDPISEDDLDMLKRVVRDMDNRRSGGRRQ
ncbi:MAG: BlaI/MecI/CopY family transcriptional regulator [Thermoguttaceae bacterium]